MVVLATSVLAFTHKNISWAPSFMVSLRLILGTGRKRSLLQKLSSKGWSRNSGIVRRTGTYDGKWSFNTRSHSALEDLAQR